MTNTRPLSVIITTGALLATTLPLISTATAECVPITTPAVEIRTAEGTFYYAGDSVYEESNGYPGLQKITDCGYNRDTRIITQTCLTCPISYVEDKL